MLTRFQHQPFFVVSSYGSFLMLVGLWRHSTCVRQVLLPLSRKGRTDDSTGLEACVLVELVIVGRVDERNGQHEQRYSGLIKRTQLFTRRRRESRRPVTHTFVLERDTGVLACRTKHQRRHDPGVCGLGQTCCGFFCKHLVYFAIIFQREWASETCNMLFIWPWIMHTLP